MSNAHRTLCASHAKAWHVCGRGGQGLTFRACIDGSGVLYAVTLPLGKELVHNPWRRNCILVVIAGMGS